MPLTVVTAPDGYPVSLQEAKLHLRVDGDSEDTLIAALIEAATQVIDGPDGWLGRSLIQRTYEYRVDGFCTEIVLPYPPIISIASVKYLDSNNVEQTVASTDYSLRVYGARSSVILGYNKSWPYPLSYRDAVRIRYVAGYASAKLVPSPIKQAILLHIGLLYEYREAALVDAPKAVPFALEALLTPFRVWSS